MGGLLGRRPVGLCCGAGLRFLCPSPPFPFSCRSFAHIIIEEFKQHRCLMRTQPDKISILVVKGRDISRDAHGYLLDPSDWDKDVATTIASEEGLELGNEHWAILDFMRDYFNEHEIPADARFVFSFLSEYLGQTSKEGRRHFFELFPYGYVKQACKIAGMRQPRAWSTG